MCLSTNCPQVSFSTLPTGVLQHPLPTNLPTGQRLRACLQGKSPAPETDDGWMELFLADRRANVTENVIPALSQGKVIVQDRYIYSTAAYQSDNTDRAVELLELQKEFPGPDGIIFLDLTPEQALQRIRYGIAVYLCVLAQG